MNFGGGDEDVAEMMEVNSSKINIHILMAKHWDEEMTDLRMTPKC